MQVAARHPAAILKIVDGECSGLSPCRSSRFRRCLREVNCFPAAFVGAKRGRTFFCIEEVVRDYAFQFCVELSNSISFAAFS